MAAPEIHHSIDALEDEWDDLADRTGAGPFLRPGWVERWWRAFGSGRLDVVAVRREGHLAAVIPLTAGRSRTASTTNWHTPLFGPLAEDESALGEVARGVTGRVTGRLDLGFLDPADRGYRALLEAARARRHATRVDTLTRPPYVATDCDWEAYAEGLGRKPRKELARLGRRLGDLGEVSYEFDDGREGLDRRLGEGLAIEASGWKGETAIAAREDTRAFYGEVARWAADRGWLRLAFLRLDGRALAFDFLIEDGTACHALKGGFDPEFARLGPGRLLTYETLRRAFDTPGLRSYEFLGTDDPYKAGWATSTRERVRLRTFAPSPTGLAALGAVRGRALGGRARAGLRQVAQARAAARASSAARSPDSTAPSM